MKELIIKTQKELDKIKQDFQGYIYIEGGTWDKPLILKTNFEEARVVARGDVYVVARENSHVEARESSHVEARESSHVVAWESSHVVAWGSSHVEARESSHVVARGNSHHKLMGEATVSAFSAKEIVASGYNVVVVRKSDRNDIKIVVNRTSTLKIVPDFKPTFADFQKRFPVEVNGKTAILYKAVHKKETGYFSDYSPNFEYKIGEIMKHKNDTSKDNSCSFGLHVSEKSWAISFGLGWSDMALLECEVPISKIVVSKDCDGKVRTSELKVLREVSKEEWI